MSQVTQFIPPHPLNTSVLFLVFNRLDTTKQVFEAIRQAKPPRLYVAADGARANKEGEVEKVQAVRDYIMQNIDWECEVKTLFREQNLGCKYAVSGAITWFFENEEQGIILEDDCLPSQSFFWYCEDLLDKYKDDLRVWHISGDNFQNGDVIQDSDYFFSKYSYIWGWASWKNRWREYDVEIKSFETFVELGQINNCFESPRVQRYWLDLFKQAYDGTVDTWDFQWTYTILSNNGVAVVPNKNLISNIGFGAEATHTVDLESKLANIEIEEFAFPIKHPFFLVIAKKADSFIELNNFITLPIHSRILNKLKKLIVR